jgi:hypothetical protein
LSILVPKSNREPVNIQYYENLVPLKRHTVPFNLFLLVCFNSKAQYVSFLDGKIELGVNLGPSFFLGDLGGIRGKGKPFVKDVNFPFTKLLKGVYINYYPAEWIGFRIAGLLTMLLVFVIIVLTTVAAVYIADGIATSMGAKKDINKSAQWIIYGFTPLYVIFILGIIPMTDNTLLWIIIIAGFAFSAFVLYQGAPILKGTAPDKTVAYTAAVVVISIILFIVLEKIGEKVLQKMLTPKIPDYGDYLDYR